MKLCMGCMKQIADQLSACPYCGFNETTLRQESYYLDPGTIVGGKYILGKVLNYGGHTISYLGMNAEANIKVIVKEYLPSDFSTRSEGEKEITIYSGDGQIQFEQGLTNFLNEANRIQQLGSPDGIAKIYDCVAENDTGYVISEYVEGRTLKEILASGKKYSAKEAKVFIAKILKGLAKVHKMDIVHCDISPETIMVTNTGEIKLLDFGATRYVTTANSKSLSIILKRGYAPEEQYRSKGVRGPWTDVYALGAVMYQMITGIVPQESVERVLDDELKPPSKLGISIPENMENALLNALNVYQEERTQSAEAFLKELNSQSVKRIKPRKKSNKTGKFPLWAKGLVACLGCAVLAGGILLFRQLSDGSGSVSGDTVYMEDLTGMTAKEAKEYINDLNNDYGWNLVYAEGDSIFDLSQAEGTISSQSIASGTVLKEGKNNPSAAGETEEANEKNTEAPISEKQMDDSDEQKDIEPVENSSGRLIPDKDGKLSGTITCNIYTQKKIRYAEIRDLNAYQLANKLKIDTKDTSLFTGETENQEGRNYYDILNLQVDGKDIPIDDIQEKEGEIAYKGNNISIQYSKAPFFYWEKLPDFMHTNLSKKTYPVYEWEAETDKEPKKVTEKELLGTNLVAADYYSIYDDRPVGCVVIQSEGTAGKLFDSSKGLEEPLLHVIADNKRLDGMTGYAAKEAVEAWDGNITVKPAGSGDMSQPVENADVLDVNGKEIRSFRLKDPVTIKLNLKKKPDPVQKNNSGSDYDNVYSGKPSSPSSTNGSGNTWTGDPL